MNNDLNYSHEDIARKLHDTLILHDDKEPMALARILVTVLGDIYRDGCTITEEGKGFNLKVNRKEQCFDCSYGDMYAGKMPFDQVVAMTLTKLQALPDGHDMGALDLNLIVPTTLEEKRTLVTTEEL